MTSRTPGTRSIMIRSMPALSVRTDDGQVPQAPTSWRFTTPSSREAVGSPNPPQRVESSSRDVWWRPTESSLYTTRPSRSQVDSRRSDVSALAAAVPPEEVDQFAWVINVSANGLGLMLERVLDLQAPVVVQIRCSSRSG